MTHRILAPLKTFALSIGLRLAAGKSRLAETAVPEPIREYLNPNAVDEWMFDRDGSPVTEAATLYSRDFGRVSNTTLRHMPPSAPSYPCRLPLVQSRRTMSCSMGSRWLRIMVTYRLKTLISSWTWFPAASLLAPRCLTSPEP